MEELLVHGQWVSKRTYKNLYAFLITSICVRQKLYLCISDEGGAVELQLLAVSYWRLTKILRWVMKGGVRFYGNL